jgi:hypothetical protein
MAPVDWNCVCLYINVFEKVEHSLSWSHDVAKFKRVLLIPIGATTSAPEWQTFDVAAAVCSSVMHHQLFQPSYFLLCVPYSFLSSLSISSFLCCFIRPHFHCVALPFAMSAVFSFLQSHSKVPVRFLYK